MYYAVIELPKYVWGLGESEQEALQDANHWFQGYTGNRCEQIEIAQATAFQPDSFVMRRCSRYFFNKMQWTEGWNVDLRFVDNHVLFPEELEGPILPGCNPELFYSY